VLPLLQQQHGCAVGRVHQRGRLHQSRVLGAVDETGEVAVAVVGPADRLLGDDGDARQLRGRLHHRVEDEVVRAPEPQHEVVLGGGHREAVRPDHRLGEARDARRRGRRRVRGPQLRAEPHHEVDPGHRAAQCRGPGHGGDQIGHVDAVASVELQVGVRQGAEREDAGLRVGHGA
jgi:hypothetical protein